MKKLLTALAIAAASTALAVESSNTFGILRVDSSDPVTIVSVPWLAAGGGDIAITDVVKTANLHDGDKLNYYNGFDYDQWVLSGGVWTAPTKVGEGAGRAAPAGLKRGNAIILERFAPENGSIGTCFYLYGQYTAERASVSVTRDESNPTYALIAPPTTTDISLNSGIWSGAMPGDQIILPSAQPLYWGGDVKKWSTLSTDMNTGAETYETYSEKIPAGSGVWMRAKKGSGPVSVQW